MADTKPVGLTLDPDYYEKLRLYADAHHWPVATAARIIVREFLDQHELSEQTQVMARVPFGEGDL